MITCFGWTWEYIENNMDIPRLQAILSYQESNPPIHQMVAAYFGVGSSKKSEEKVITKITEDKEEQKQQAENLINFLNQNNMTKSTYQGPRMQ